jgi:mannitol-1-/sugar-/sorbitol-6-phosphatase
MTEVDASTRDRMCSRSAAGTAVVVSAVLFDLDGTLVDTSIAVELSWRQVTAELGVPFERLEPFIHGIPAGEVLACALPAMPVQQRALLAEQVLATQASDGAIVSMVSGARELLGCLPVERWAIVTSGDERLARASIRKAGVPEPLEMVTADDVSSGKPDPEPYLRAARLLNVAAEECLVVEDSPAGVAAGRAAGMAVLALTTTFPELGGATWVVPDLTSVSAAAVPEGIRLEIAHL